jgi:MFS family permease
MITNSSWVALRNPAFRKLWTATVISGICVAAHDNAATWMMNASGGSPLFLSLMSTLASLACFLFILPAGALADRVDRPKLVCTINILMAATAFALAVLGWMHLLDPYLILLYVFLVGIGFAINAPAWTSIVRQVVCDSELPSAAILGCLQFSIAGIVGPALGGLLVLLAGASFVFALNAGCFLLKSGARGAGSFSRVVPTLLVSALCFRSATWVFAGRRPGSNPGVFPAPAGTSSAWRR